VRSRLKSKISASRDDRNSECQSCPRLVNNMNNKTGGARGNLINRSQEQSEKNTGV